MTQLLKYEAECHNWEESLQRLKDENAYNKMKLVKLSDKNLPKDVLKSLEDFDQFFTRLDELVFFLKLDTITFHSLIFQNSAQADQLRKINTLGEKLHNEIQKVNQEARKQFTLFSSTIWKYIV